MKFAPERGQCHENSCIFMCYICHKLRVCRQCGLCGTLIPKTVLPTEGGNLGDLQVRIGVDGNDAISPLFLGPIKCTISIAKEVGG